MRARCQSSRNFIDYRQDKGKFGIELSSNGQMLKFCNATTTTGTMTGTTVTLTNLIPAGVLVLGATARVLTAITGPTSWMFGITGDTDLWGATNALTKGTEINGAVTGTVAYPFYNAAALSVLITRGSGVDFTAGNIRVTVYYLSWTVATA